MKMLCKFKTTPLGGGLYRHDCTRSTCTQSRTNGSPTPPLANCNGIPETKRLFNFTLAMIQHAIHRFPSCTQEEVDARLAICRGGCPLYKKINDELGYCTHPTCGCTIRNFAGFVSKVGWRDQVCPIGKWPLLPPAKSQEPNQG